MSKAKVARLAGFTVALGATASLAAFAATGTGAYFSDAKTGNVISGTMGSIAITGHDGGGAHHLGISFANMLPGDTSSKTVGFTNTGKNPEDVYVVFDQSALGDHNAATNNGLNDLGHFASVEVDSAGSPVFRSSNLNDDPASCPTVADGHRTDCSPLPHVLKLAENLAPGADGSMTFSFMPSAAFQNVQNVQLLNLPYTLVATQHGIAPDNSLNSTVVN